MFTMFRLPLFWVFLCLLPGCSFLLDWSGEGTPCNDEQPCLTGYFCSAGKCRAVPDGGYKEGFNTLPSLVEARSYHTATLLPSGKVLVAGGNGAKPLNSFEVFDPATMAWAKKGNLVSPRVEHSATLLADNRVLFVGGRSDIGDSSLLKSAEVFDEASGTSVAVKPLVFGRSFHTATALLDGRVVVAGGYPAGVATEVYSLQNDVWTTHSKPAQNRYHHRTVRLGEKVFVLGGQTTESLLDNEMLDTQTLTFSNRASLNVRRSGFAAVRLAGDRILVAGGYQPETNKYLASAEIYDSATNLWTPVASMATERSRHAAVVLADGRVLVAGGQNEAGKLRSAEIFDPQTSTWGSAGDLSVARTNLTATKLLDNSVLFVGGEANNGASAVVDLFVP